MIFHDPLILVLLFPVIVFFALALKKRKKHYAGIQFPSEILLRSKRQTARLFMVRYLIFLRIACACLVVFALARPQMLLNESEVKTEGIDIVLAVDCSTSMLAEDFKLHGKRKSRLDVTKDVMEEFIRMRPDDRLALVAFAGEAYTVCPLTLDHAWLLENLKRIHAGMLEDGTAIGMGITVSLNRLKESRAKNKIVILLTDGRNNVGKISPETAAQAAKALKVKIYTIGAGSKGLVPYPFQNIFGKVVYRSIEIDIDEKTLIDIANTTEARYFRATDTQSLRKIYQEIDKLEKVTFQEKGYQQYRELFTPFLVVALILLFLEIALKATFLRIIP
ncbi:MAG: VWA domain-containing protein [Candidatus Omnitrophota bacterium]